jgi:hypothetical protein
MRKIRAIGLLTAITFGLTTTAHATPNGQCDGVNVQIDRPESALNFDFECKTALRIGEQCTVIAHEGADCAAVTMTCVEGDLFRIDGHCTEAREE